jgi:hypothetical protein
MTNAECQVGRAQQHRPIGGGPAFPLSRFPFSHSTFVIDSSFDIRHSSLSSPGESLSE